MYVKEKRVNLLEKLFEKDSRRQAIAFSFRVKKLGFVGKSMPKLNDLKFGRVFLSSATNPNPVSLSIREFTSKLGSKSLQNQIIKKIPKYRLPKRQTKISQRFCMAQNF